MGIENYSEKVMGSFKNFRVGIKIPKQFGAGFREGPSASVTTELTENI